MSVGALSPQPHIESGQLVGVGQLVLGKSVQDRFVVPGKGEVRSLKVRDWELTLQRAFSAAIASDGTASGQLFLDAVELTVTRDRKVAGLSLGDQPPLAHVGGSHVGNSSSRRGVVPLFIHLQFAARIAAGAQSEQSAGTVVVALDDPKEVSEAVTAAVEGMFEQIAENRKSS